MAKAPTNPFELLGDDDGAEQIVSKKPKTPAKAAAAPVKQAAKPTTAKPKAVGAPKAEAGNQGRQIKGGERPPRTNTQNTNTTNNNSPNTNNRGGGNERRGGGGTQTRPPRENRPPRPPAQPIPSEGVSAPDLDAEKQRIQEKRGEASRERHDRRGGRGGQYTDQGGKRVFERRSGTGRPLNENKKGGAGRGNWGKQVEDEKKESEADEATVKEPVPEKKDQQAYVEEAKKRRRRRTQTWVR